MKTQVFLKNLLSQSRKDAKILFLILVLLLFSCTSEDESGNLHGTWISDFGDGYIINLDTKHLTYDDGFDGGYDGVIKEVNFFDGKKTSGIIFIEYINKPINYQTGLPPSGDFIGIYFKELAETQVSLAPPFTEEDWVPAKLTLENAKNTFTVDNIGDFVTFWSVCVKQ